MRRSGHGLFFKLLHDEVCKSVMPWSRRQRGRLTWDGCVDATRERLSLVRRITRESALKLTTDHLVLGSLYGSRARISVGADSHGFDSKRLMVFRIAWLQWHDRNTGRTHVGRRGRERTAQLVINARWLAPSESILQPMWSPGNELLCPISERGGICIVIIGDLAVVQMACVLANPGWTFSASTVSVSLNARSPPAAYGTWPSPSSPSWIPRMDRSTIRIASAH